MKTFRYVLVRFDDTAKKLQSYRTKNKKLKVHDLVIVPVGKDNHPEVAEIMLAKDFSKNEVPYPLEKTKQVTCKATKIRCFFAALGAALDNAIIEREKRKELEWKADDLSWIDDIEAWSAFMDD